MSILSSITSIINMKQNNTSNKQLISNSNFPQQKQQSNNLISANLGEKYTKCKYCHRIL
ncbi:hypothetical protein DDB_G0281879 [Dictyostelium discoideum AX4]|uniref:Putative uncharacterized protein DDB_G0281879 n=1 Tax=Dictyostelium discoideum TaxID=44689 RepID=Y4264_DICDI|nr:hypothetical protein DDB_G0281879 [Dictyostelium discoideum AX4]Q54TB4.1 RecName: Full=Putative uncharacterized protein DDB_G0281879 [Dictyostelium discoideum]EAL66499.1 hypothetical protein DDB_G0281879 [Dictyostelium discoideum AX4]|eukprot:XP_640475.1 hypothetical protein DDB_G0281879 [Dictyostelium discoideum AX4]